MKNVLVLTYWSYPDALIQTYTLPYVRILKDNLQYGSSVYLLTLEKNPDNLTKSKRDQISAQLMSDGIYWLPLEYKPFGFAAFFLWIKAFFKLSHLIISKKISVIHCWCTPPGAIGYFLSLLLNRKLVLDSYEPHAEAMVENGTWKKNGIAFRLLFWLEKKQTQKADYIIAATEGMRHYAKKKYHVDLINFVVKPACVDLQLFSNTNPTDESLRRNLGLENKIVCVYAGKFGGIYLDNEVFDFIRVAANYWGEAFRFLILTNHTISEIHSYCARAGVDVGQVIVRFVPHQEVARFMQLADFALTPVKPVPTKRYCTPIKDGEYWALGLPVVIPAGISDDSLIVEKNGIGAVLNAFTEISYKEAILKIDNLRRQPGIQAVIRSIAVRHRSYSIAEEAYRKAYATL